jgi:protein-tyrosine-phosphatase
MKELPYDLSLHDSKSLDDIPQITYDHVITMGCGDACPFVKTHQRSDWQIPDPGDMYEADFRKVRDLIEEKVKELLQKL